MAYRLLLIAQLRIYCHNIVGVVIFQFLSKSYIFNPISAHVGIQPFSGQGLGHIDPLANLQFSLQKDDFQVYSIQNFISSNFCFVTSSRKCVSNLFCAIFTFVILALRWSTNSSPFINSDFQHDMVMGIELTLTDSCSKIAAKARGGYDLTPLPKSQFLTQEKSFYM